jgi:hypothetical protein
MDINKLLAGNVGGQQAPVPPQVQAMADFARKMNPVFVLLDLMTKTQDLNPDEENQVKLKGLQSATIDRPTR